MKKLVVLGVCIVGFQSMRAWDLGSYYLIKLFDDYYDARSSTQELKVDEGDEWINQNKNGTSRYEKILHDDLRQRFRTQALVVHEFSSECAYDRCSNQISLARWVFNDNPLLLSEVYLPGRLAIEGYLVPSDSEECFACDQYMPYLADTELHFTAGRTRTKLDLSMSYEFPFFDGHRFNIIIGGNFPLVYERHLLELVLRRGGLSSPEFQDAGSEIPLFFKEFNSVNDFINGFVLSECKDLCFDKCQRRFGLGDLAVFFGFEFGRYINEETLSVAGINLSLPTSKKISGNTIWEVELGNGGATTFSPFWDMQLHVNNIVNPSWHIAGFFSPPFTAKRRVPQCRTLKEEAEGADTDLCLTSTFDCFKIKPFSFIDSKSAPLADYASCVRIARGVGGMFRIGNTLRNLFDVTSLEVGIFYMASFKRGDCIDVERVLPQVPTPFEETNDNKAKRSGFNTDALNESHNVYAHILEWKVSYQPHEHIGFSIGLLHMIAGQNMPKHHMLMAKINGYF